MLRTCMHAVPSSSKAFLVHDVGPVFLVVLSAGPAAAAAADVSEQPVVSVQWQQQLQASLR